MERSNYWSRRLSRRSTLKTAGVAGVGAASLAIVGCGGDDDDGQLAATLGTPTPGGAPTAAVIDPFAGAKHGGTYKVTAAGDPPTIDPMGNTSFQTRTFGMYAYSRLFRYKTGPGIGATDVVPQGDLVQSAELAPDQVNWTLKLKPAKFHNIAPVNGRPVTSDDVKFSWGRMTDVRNGNRGNFDFIDKVTYPDQSTVVFTLKAPNAGFTELLTDTTNLVIMPTESEGGFDPTKTMIGSGPWIFDHYTPSTTVRYKRNPDWFDKGPQDFPFMDGVEIAIIAEYAQRLAQFQAGSTDTEAPNSQDLLDLKKQVKDVDLYGYIPQQANYIFFDSDAASPWRDERVRQAISMSIPRNDVTELVYNIAKLKAGGLDLAVKWNNVIPAGASRWWLDPQSPAQGDSAKFFKHDIAEAKKLMSAAGFASGFSATYQYPGTIYGKGFGDAAEAHINFLNELGIKTTTEVQDYASKYVLNAFRGTNFKGIVFALESSFTDIGGYPTRLFTDNPINHGKINDPELIRLHAAQQKELNVEKRKELIFDIQRYNAQKMYYIPSQVGAGYSWAAYQPWLKNGSRFVAIGYGGGTETAPFRWLNRS